MTADHYTPEELPGMIVEIKERLESYASCGCGDRGGDCDFCHDIRDGLIERIPRLLATVEAMATDANKLRDMQRILAICTRRMCARFPPEDQLRKLCQTYLVRNGLQGSLLEDAAMADTRKR